MDQLFAILTFIAVIGLMLWLAFGEGIPLIEDKPVQCDGCGFWYDAEDEQACELHARCPRTELNGSHAKDAKEEEDFI